MAQLQKTDLAAYEADLANAEKEFVTAAGRVADAQKALNARRVEEGLEPLDFSAEPESKPDGEDEDTDKEKPKDDAPEEASGFGGRGKK